MNSFQEQFKNDVNSGLSGHPKFLSSKYFYDKIGDALFVKIMNMPEYYLTGAEFEIFNKKTTEIINSLDLKKDTYFELVELGAGDGTKTKELLKVLDNQGFQFDYLPVDISQNALDGLKSSLKREIPGVSVRIQQGDYFDILKSLKATDHPKVILFLGSNIGNMEDGLAADFICRLGEHLSAGDRLFLGVDLIKEMEIVLPAYNDAQGITRDFNLNLLTRINNELGGDFNIKKFKHAPEYTEKEGIAKSFLESTAEQTVTITSINRSFNFRKGERIHTEISRKYNDEILMEILDKTGFVITDKLTDSKAYFADYVLVRQ